MNIIKYLPTKYKSKCIECENPLIKDIKTHEIYCSQCGLILLDYTAITSEIIDYAMSKSEQKSEKKSEKKSYLTNRSRFLDQENCN